jgi:hypothetical protein
VSGHEQRALDGTVAHLVLRAALPWEPNTHHLFPEAARARAYELLLVGYALSRSPPYAAHTQALLDVWVYGVMAYAIERTSVARGEHRPPCSICSAQEGAQPSDDGAPRATQEAIDAVYLY